MKSTSRPAILGGSPAVTLNQEAANRWPIITEEDEQAVLSVLRDGELSTHPVLRELEKEYCEFFGLPYALAHCNGTAALLAAFWAIGLKPGDEVLVPSATFWASVLPMMWLGAVPVFCESEPERLGIDPVDMERKITDRTRAVVCVHLWGMPAKMTEIFAVARRHNLKIIEDASHAHGASWRNQLCSTLGDIAVFSLQGHKLAPAGEGGIFLCRDELHYERAICLGDITRIIELPTPARRFAATSFGIKTRMAPMSAALGRSQLGKLKVNNQRRNANLEYLSRGLENLGIHTFLPPPHIHRVYFEYIVRPDLARIGLGLDLLEKALQAEGCLAAQPRYPLVHQQPYFTEGACTEVLRLPPGNTAPRYLPDTLPHTERNSASLMKLPAFPCADPPLLDQYIYAFNKVIRNAPEIAAQEARD